MDVEDESISVSVFKDSFPDSWRDNPDFSAYSAELSSFGSDQSGREPERSAEERNQISQQTRESAFSNYQTFIRTADCTELIYRDFGRVESSVSRSSDKSPRFGERCRTFMKEAEQIGVSRRMNSLTSNRHTEISEISEIPQSMDTCVRNGYYEEASESAAYARRSEKKHAASPVIQGIVREVRQSAQSMLNQLLQQSRSNSQLPVCSRVIGYSRRMDVFTEAELRVKFSQARGGWSSAVSAAVPEDDPYFHVTKTMEACRVHSFDIITQYRAIFSDEEPSAPPAGGGGSGEAAIFHGWVVQKVAQFSETSERDSRRGVGGRSDSSSGQCMYFGSSFSRVGADFRGQSGPLFQRVASEGFRGAVREAAERFQEDMNGYTSVASPSGSGGAAAPVAPGVQPGTSQPPMASSDFPPSACFLNNISVAFNESRLCCPSGVAQDVSRSSEDGSKAVTRCVSEFYRAEQSAFSAREKELFVQFCSAYAEDSSPFSNRCSQVSFPPAQLASVSGVPVSQSDRYGGSGRVDVSAVSEPLRLVLPQKEAEPPVPEVDVTAESGALTFDPPEHVEPEPPESGPTEPAAGPTLGDTD